MLFENKEYVLMCSEEPEIGDEIYLVNRNCEFNYDSTTGNFCREKHNLYEVEVEIINEDLSNYIPKKSNNGGCYAFATAIVKNCDLYHDWDEYW